MQPMTPRRNWTRLAVLAAILAAIVAFFAFDLHHWLSFEQVKAQQAAVEAYRSQHPWLKRLLPHLDCALDVKRTDYTVFCGADRQVYKTGAPPRYRHFLATIHPLTTVCAPSRGSIWITAEGAVERTG